MGSWTLDAKALLLAALVWGASALWSWIAVAVALGPERAPKALQRLVWRPGEHPNRAGRIVRLLFPLGIAVGGQAVAIGVLIQGRDEAPAMLLELVLAFIWIMFLVRQYRTQFKPPPKRPGRPQ